MNCIAWKCQADDSTFFVTLLYYLDGEKFMHSQIIAFMIQACQLQEHKETKLAGFAE